MALILGYGGSVSLNFQSAGAVTFPARNVSVSYERSSIDTTQLSDYREKRAPGRWRRTATFDMIAQDGNADDAVRSHMTPSTVGDTQNRTVVLSWTDAGSKVYTMTGHITSAARSDDGSGPATWSITLEEA